MIKLIACDLDGTALNDKKVLDSELIRLKPILKEMGVELTFITGRNEEILKDFVDEANIDVPYATNNGANIFKEHNRIETDCIEQEYNNYLASLLYEYDIPNRIFTLENIYALGWTPFFEERMKYYEGRLKEYHSDMDISNDHINKITADFGGHPESVDEVYKKAIAKCPNIAFLKADTDVYTINSATANKGEALKRICKLLDIDVKDTMTFGDNGTDIPMVEMAGIGVIMANGEEEVKKHADYICEDNNSQGVSKFIKEYFKL